jgi:hydroxyacylglutathione hydrolase
MFGPKEVTVHEAHEALGTDKHCLIDVRTHDEVAGGAVPGSLHIPLDRLEAHVDKLKDFDSIHVMCRSGGRSSIATDILHKMGMKQAINVRGGMLAWQAAKLPVTQ